MLVRFLRNREAGIAPMLALAALPLFGFAGAAVASAVRTLMQAALYATALMLSKKLKNSPDTPLSSTATTYFNANFVRPEAQNVQVTPPKLKAAPGSRARSRQQPRSRRTS
jgi:Flp pilus assembly protein TadG